MDAQDPIARLAFSRRILVLGSSGSGKTTFAVQLSRILDITTIHLDAHFWKPGWIATPKPQWREIVSSLVQEPSWIMDGTYESTLDLRIPAADAVILIENSRWTCLWRVLKRQATSRGDQRSDAPKGKKPDRSFSRFRIIIPHYASWLRYIWRYPNVIRPFVLDSIQQYGSDKPTIHVNGSNDIQSFFRQLQQAVETRSEQD